MKLAPVLGVSGGQAISKAEDGGIGRVERCDGCCHGLWLSCVATFFFLSLKMDPIMGLEIARGHLQKCCHDQGQSPHSLGHNF